MGHDVIVVTGASSGFGRLSAEALALAGHTVYASMRDTKGRNASQVEAVGYFAKDNGVDLRTVEMDVQSQSSVDGAIEKVFNANGRSESTGPCCRACDAAARPSDVDIQQQLSRGDTALSGAVFRGKSRDGRARGDLRARANPVGHRDFHYCSRRIHQRHQPLRASRRARRPDGDRRV
jgi:NAD(P)-dependent dehydrogenase (short-subunit alcohol dehydrogenase family)